MKMHLLHTQIFNASEITVRLAEHDLSTDKETTIVTRSVSQIIDHPEYDPDSKPHDISLLKLSSPVEVRDLPFFLSF